MSSDEIRNADYATLLLIVSGLVRANCDNFSKQIAHGEIEKRKRVGRIGGQY